MPDFEKLLKSKQAEKLLSSPSAMDYLSKSKEAKQLAQLLGKNTDGDLDAIAAQARRGQTQPLSDMIEKLMRDPECTRLLNDLSKNIKP